MVQGSVTTVSQNQALTPTFKVIFSHLGHDQVGQLPKARGVPSPAAVLDINFDGGHPNLLPLSVLELQKDEGKHRSN